MSSHVLELFSHVQIGIIDLAVARHSAIHYTTHASNKVNTDMNERYIHHLTTFRLFVGVEFSRIHRDFPVLLNLDYII